MHKQGGTPTISVVNMQPQIDSWSFALTVLRRLGLPPGVVPTQISITVSSGQAVTLPVFPPSAAEVAMRDEFTPSPAQLRIMQACRAGPKSATQLRAVESNIYRAPGGISELQAHGLMERAENGRYALTEFGREFVDASEVVGV